MSSDANIPVRPPEETTGDGGDPSSNGPQTPDVFGRYGWILLGSIFALGCYLRMSDFNAYWINPDEGIYYSMVSSGRWADFWVEFSGNAHPPLFYLALRTVGAVSNEIASLRSVALVFGCGCVPAAFLLARECAGRGTVATLTGLFAALLTAISYTAIQMSQIIRPYTTQIFALTLGLFYLVKFVQRGSRRAMPMYVLWMSVAMLTHYSTLLVLAGAAVTILGTLFLKRLTAGQFRTLVLWNLPLLFVFGALYLLHIRPNLEGSKLASDALGSWLRPFLLDRANQIWPHFLGVLRMIFGPSYEGPAAVAFVAGIVLAASRKHQVIVLLAMTILAVAVTASMAHKYPFGCSRHSLYLSVVLILPMAFGIALGLTNGLRSAIVTLAVAAGMLFYPMTITTALESEMPILIPEKVLTRSDFTAMRPLLDKVRSTEGVLVLPLQSYYLFLPEFAEEGHEATWSRDRSFRRFRWGKRDVVVMEEWTLSLALHDVGTPKHLHSFVKNVDVMMPDLRLSQREDVIFFFGGWSTESRSLEVFRTGGPSSRSLVRSRYAVPGFAAIEFELGAYMRLMTNVLRSFGR